MPINSDFDSCCSVHCERGEGEGEVGEEHLDLVGIFGLRVKDIVRYWQILEFSQRRNEGRECKIG